VHPYISSEYLPQGLSNSRLIGRTEEPNASASVRIFASGNSHCKSPLTRKDENLYTSKTTSHVARCQKFCSVLFSSHKCWSTCKQNTWNLCHKYTDVLLLISLTFTKTKPAWNHDFM
jgi:hypothetical protein